MYLYRKILYYHHKKYVVNTHCHFHTSNQTDKYNFYYNKLDRRYYLPENILIITIINYEKNTHLWNY